MGKYGSNSKVKKPRAKVKTGIARVGIFFSLLILFIIGCGDEEKLTLDITKLSGEYLGEPFPFDEAEVFLNGLTDDNHSIPNIAFSPDGEEFYFTLTTLEDETASIMVSYLKNDFWTEPELVEFSTEFNESDPFITNDNKKLFFVSDRPAPGISEDESYFDYNIWYVERMDTGWSEPKFIFEINSNEDEYSPSLTETGKIYFSSARSNSEGYWDIYESEFINGKFVEPRKLLSPVNTKYGEWDPFIFSEDQKMLFVSDRPGGFGGGDIYFCEKNKNGIWKEPVNLGININTNDYEYFPRISYDGKFMFFTRVLINEKYFYQDKAPDTRDPFEYIYLPGSGRSLVYWVMVDSLSVIKF